METFLKIWKKLSTQSNPEKAESITSVAVFGSSDAKEESGVYKDAFKVAFTLAKVGYTIVDGGGPGVMRAATQGAKAGGGRVIGVTLYPKDKVANFEGRDLENPIDEEIKTDSYVERTLTLMKEGQIYVVFNGGTGTVSEFGMAWGLARIYFGHHKPLILYGNFWHKIMRSLKKNLMLRPEELRVYKIVNSPEDVLRAIRQFEEEIHQGKHEHLETTHETRQPLQTAL